MNNINGLEIEPNILKFNGPFTGGVPERVQIHLHNSNSDKLLAYKVKTIKPNQYLVNPIKGIIAPQQRVTVIVELQQLPDEAAVADFVKSKQKFLIQSVLASANSHLSIAELFTNGNVAETKLSCAFDEPNEASYKSVKGRVAETSQASSYTSGYILKICVVFAIMAILVAIGVKYKKNYYGKEVTSSQIRQHSNMVVGAIAGIAVVLGATLAYIKFKYSRQ